MQATVVTSYPAEFVQQLSFTQIQDRLIVLHQNYAPAQLIRSSNSANVITGVNATDDTLVLTVSLTTNTIYPILFTTGGTLPVTSPQIYVNTLYYARQTSANNVRIFTLPEDAADNINYYAITSAGGGTSNVVTQNTWALSAIAFSNKPSFDFDAFVTYSASTFTFTASAISGTIGAPLTITASGAVFTAAHVGGIFRGNGGVMRITVYTDTTHVNGYTYDDFVNTSAFPGADSYLGEPAWSANRGYPSCGTFFQERFFLAGSRGIPNGLWGSTIFAVYDFNDALAEADNAISFYPAAGSSNYINALTSSKSLIVHTNTGNYSTPLTTDLPLTPANFSLTEQNKDGISRVIPVFIDNQIIYVDRSGKNIKSMFWDITQSSYVNTNISLPSSHLVRTPIDMAVFSEPFYTDGYYIIAVNSDGKLAIYNSLSEQDIKGWTTAATSQNISNTIASIDSINSYLVLTNNLAVGQTYAVTFATTSALPTTSPQIVAGVSYYIRAITTTSIRIYENLVDAINNDNYFSILSAGAGTNVVLFGDDSSLAGNGYFRRVTAGLNRAWVVVERTINASTVLYLEELDFEYPLDCGKKYTFTSATSALTGLSFLEGQSVQVYADGCVQSNQVVVSGAITLDTPALVAYVGLGFRRLIETLPINVMMQNGPTLYQKQHVRTLYIHYYESIGLQIQGDEIPTLTTQQVILNSAAIPATGVFEYTLMEGWDAFDYTIQISQSLPLPMTLLAVGYNIEVIG